MYARRVVLDGGNTRALCGGCCATPEFICACILRYISRLPVTRQLGLFSMLGLWALLTLIGVFFAVWTGYGGHEHSNEGQQRPQAEHREQSELARDGQAGIVT